MSDSSVSDASVSDAAAAVAVAAAAVVTAAAAVAVAAAAVAAVAAARRRLRCRSCPGSCSYSCRDRSSYQGPGEGPQRDSRSLSGSHLQEDFVQRLL